MHKAVLLSITFIALLISAETAISHAVTPQQNTTIPSADDHTETYTPSDQNHHQQTIPNIQEQINTCPPGSTITLPPGTYHEILTIDKPLTLQGTSADTTILSVTSTHNSYALEIKSPRVNLKNLTIENQGPGLYTTAVKIVSPQTRVENCHIQNTPVGIAVWSNHNTITSCIFTNCKDEGIVLLGSSHQSVSHNYITHSQFENNCDGIELQYATHTTIAHCTFTKNTHAGIDAIQQHNNHNSITHCTFTKNQGYGIYLASSNYNIIDNCRLTEETVFLNNVQQITLQDSEITTLRYSQSQPATLKNCVITETSSTYFDESKAGIEKITEKTKETMQQSTQTIVEMIQQKIRGLISYLQNTLDEDYH